MSKNQIVGFIIFNIGLVLTGIFTGLLAYKYKIDILDLIPTFGSMLLMVSGLLILSFLKKKS